MSEERLEEISKNAVGILNMDSGKVDSIDISIIDFTWLFKFAKEQSERVQELEKANKTLSDNHFQQIEQHMYLVQQNNRYREALEFYANEDNYNPEYFSSYFSSVGYDEGYKARKALRRESKWNNTEK